jgi:hypothetical protein
MSRLGQFRSPVKGVLSPHHWFGAYPHRAGAGINGQFIKKGFRYAKGFAEYRQTHKRWYLYVGEILGEIIFYNHNICSYVMNKLRNIQTR